MDGLKQDNLSNCSIKISSVKEAREDTPPKTALESSEEVSSARLDQGEILAFHWVLRVGFGETHNSQQVESDIWSSSQVEAPSQRMDLAANHQEMGPRVKDQTPSRQKTSKNEGW